MASVSKKNCVPNVLLTLAHFKMDGPFPVFQMKLMFGGLVEQIGTLREVVTGASF